MELHHSPPTHWYVPSIRVGNLYFYEPLDKVQPELSVVSTDN